MESTLYNFLPDGVFQPCDHGLHFDISLLGENSINQSFKGVGGSRKAMANRYLK